MQTIEFELDGLPAVLAFENTDGEPRASTNVFTWILNTGSAVAVAAGLVLAPLSPSEVAKPAAVQTRRAEDNFRVAPLLVAAERLSHVFRSAPPEAEVDDPDYGI